MRSPDLLPLLFDDSRQVSDNIRLNQLGYLPDRNKHAYLGQYMGDAGPMPFEATEFHLLDAGGQKVHTGQPTRREVNEKLVGINPSLTSARLGHHFAGPGNPFYRLLHAAGLEISRFLADKAPSEFDLVFDVKSDGWFNLMHAAQYLPIGATVVFSSIAGRFGNAGQTDYSAANDLLCKLTSGLRRTRPETRALALDWIQEARGSGHVQDS